MAASSASAPPATGRVSTGIPPLDTMLEGGLLAHRPYLVVGPSGTGKTTLALEFLCEGIRRGERCLLVTIEEPPNEARVNHRSIGSELDRVDVFDAIPDIMRYERVPFKDIAAVRSSQPFASVPLSIRLSPELSAVEVTLTALEQMLRSEVIRKGYSRLAIDSLTALQYFCMKGFDPVGGAQTFLRFLSDLRVTTILTVESPLEDLETPERALARGEIRLFRWEHENMTVRAIGVEKFRGSSHDVRLHPYRIGPHGIDINLEQTISRDTRQIVEPTPPVFAVEMPSPIPIEEVVSPVDPLGEEVRDLLLAGADVGPIRGEIEAALAAIAEDDFKRCREHITRASALAIALCGTIPHPPTEADGDAPEVRGEGTPRAARRGGPRRCCAHPTSASEAPRDRARARAGPLLPERGTRGRPHATGAGGCRCRAREPCDGTDAGARPVFHPRNARRGRGHRIGRRTDPGRCHPGSRGSPAGAGVPAAPLGTLRPRGRGTARARSGTAADPTPRRASSGSCRPLRLLPQGDGVGPAARAVRAEHEPLGRGASAPSSFPALGARPLGRPGQRSVPGRHPPNRAAVQRAAPPPSAGRAGPGRRGSERRSHRSRHRRGAEAAAEDRRDRPAETRVGRIRDPRQPGVRNASGGADPGGRI